MRHDAHGRIIDTLLQGALADGRHKACITLRYGGLVLRPRHIRVNRLVNRAIELQQVLEDLSRSEVLLSVWPLVCIDHLFTLVYEGLSHVEQPLS